MDQGEFVSQGIGAWRPKPEKVAERLPPGQLRNAVGARGQFRFEAACEPQLIRTERIGLTG